VAAKIFTVVTAESRNGLATLITEMHEAATHAKARGYARTARRLDECGFELAAMVSGTDSAVAPRARRARTALAVWRVRSIDRGAAVLHARHGARRTTSVSRACDDADRSRLVKRVCKAEAVGHFKVSQRFSLGASAGVNCLYANPGA
jgi:hypothetical protein